MIETIVKCDGCGEVIYDGYMKDEYTKDAHVIDFDHHYCDNCKDDSMNQEFRTCDYCHKPMIDGFTVEGGGWYCCEDCFEPIMKRDYPNGYKPNDHDDDPYWCDGMWDYLDDDGKWRDTGIFYTEWY